MNGNKARAESAAGTRGRVRNLDRAPLLFHRHPEVPERSGGLEGRRPGCRFGRSSFALHASRCDAWLAPWDDGIGSKRLSRLRRGLPSHRFSPTRRTV